MSTVRTRPQTSQLPQIQSGVPPTAPLLEDYVKFVRQYWYIITATIMVCVLVGVGFQYLLPAKFKARTDVVLVSTTELTTAARSSRDVSIDSSIQVLLSDQVLGATARSLTYPGRSSGLLDDLSISPLINSRILQLNVSSGTPKQAFDAVTLLAKNFLAARQQSMNAARDAQIVEVHAKLSSVNASIEKSQSIDQFQGHVLAESTRALVKLKADLQTELISLSVIDPAPGYISHEPSIPTSSTRPGLTISAGSSMAIGLLVGCFLSVVVAARKSRRTRTLTSHTDRRKVSRA